MLLQCSAYHGGLDLTMRKKSLRTFEKATGLKAKSSLHVIVATSAFGLGVNLPSVKVRIEIDCDKQSVIHIYGVRSIQEYVQEIGRYRGQHKHALCASFLSDNTINKLYSSLFSSSVNSASIRRFVNDIMQESEKVFTYVCFRFAEQKYDVSESTIRTILILLENQGFIRLDVDFNNRYIITPIDYNLVMLNSSIKKQLLQKSVFFASIFHFCNNYDPNTSLLRGRE